MQDQGGSGMWGVWSGGNPKFTTFSILNNKYTILSNYKYRWWNKTSQERRVTFSSRCCLGDLYPLSLCQKGLGPGPRQIIAYSIQSHLQLVFHLQLAVKGFQIFLPLQYLQLNQDPLALRFHQLVSWPSDILPSQTTRYMRNGLVKGL